MKRLLTAVLICALLLPMLTAPAQAAGDPLNAEAAVLIDADTGEILYQKNMHQLMEPASITKILTGLLVMENVSEDEYLTVQETAANIPKGYAHINLSAGEQIQVRDAMYAMMLPSANDAAYALAEHTAGSQYKFLKMMNQRAEEIGAKNTYFNDAGGIPYNGHHSTAYDMALITREAYQNKDFRRYFGVGEYTLAATSLQKPLKVKNYHYMLRSDRTEYNPYVVAGKIGYIGPKGHTMSTVATKDGKTLICVVLGCTSDGKYSDTQRILDYGFSM